jgi:site-specific DNA-methyltransferase (adenine-specific)
VSGGPYFAADGVELWLGDCFTHRAWLDAAVLLFDPPYGKDWHRATTPARNGGPKRNAADPETIPGDTDTEVRDGILALWGTDRPVVCFGHLTDAPPPGTKQTLVYAKPPDAGAHGATAGFRRDAEAIWLIGPWPASPLGGQTSILRTAARGAGNPVGLGARYGHPHAKGVDVCERLVAACPPGPIADPTAGAGSILVACRNLGREAIGCELESRYARRAAERLSEPVLFTGELPAAPELIQGALELGGDLG